MDKLVFKLLKDKNISNNAKEEISSFRFINPDRALLMGDILEKTRENGKEISPKVLERKRLKDLKVLKKSIDEFYLNGKTDLNENIILNIHKDAKPNLTKAFSEMSEQEKIEYLSAIYEKYENELINILNIEPPEKKLELLNKYIDEEVFDEEDYLKKQETQKALSILRELSFLESNKEKQQRLREKKEEENRKETSKGNNVIYNKQVYKMYEDDRLSRDKQDFLKYAYFKKGINLEEFQRNMGNELYNCSEAQLENYVELWDKYQSNYISRDDFYYGKNLVFKEEISQESIEEVVIPMLQEDTLSKKEIDECINSSIDEGDEFFKEVANLAVAAEEHNYSQEDIYELIKDAASEPIDKIHEEIELIQDKKDNQLDVDVLDKLDTDEVDLIRKYDSPIADKNFELEI